MNLQINKDFYISNFEDRDQLALLEYLQEKQIYDQTLAISDLLAVLGLMV